MSETHNEEWLLEKDALRRTSISHFLFVRYRAAGFFTTSDRPFHGRGGGSDPYLYAPSTIKIVRWLRAHRKETHSDDDRFWGLGFAGLIDLTKWADDRLALVYRKGFLRHQQHPDNLKRAAAEIARTPRTRTDPLRAPFRHLQEQSGRKLLVEWAVDIGIGEEPAISLYENSSAVRPAFEKSVGASWVPDREPDLERMSLPRLREIFAGATPAQRQQVRHDCITLDNLVRIAQAIDWHRSGAGRPSARQGNEGVSVNPVAPFERLATVWRSFDARAAILAFLIFVRQKSEYSGKLDQWFKYYATELKSLLHCFPKSSAEPEPLS